MGPWLVPAAVIQLLFISSLCSAQLLDSIYAASPPPSKLPSATAQAPPPSSVSEVTKSPPVSIFDGSAGGYGTSPPPVLTATTAVPLNTFADTATQLKEKSALLALKAALGDHPMFNYGEAGDWLEAATGFAANASLPCILGWRFLTCQNEHVVEIALSNLQTALLNKNWLKGGSPGALKGAVPWKKLSDIQYLISIDLFQNDITGPNFEDASGLTSLIHLNMQSNSLTGSIHPNLGGATSLQYLSLSFNHMTGPLPSSLANLKQLTFLDLSNNAFTGILPPGIGSLAKLQKLDVGLNKMSGYLPPTFGGLVSVQTLVLQSNAFTGSIPSTWSSMRSLKHIDISQNSIKCLFFGDWLKLSNLTDIDISSNMMFGPLPTDLFSMANITNVDVSGNYFNGSVPAVKSVSETFKFQRNCFTASSSLSSSLPQPATTCSTFYTGHSPASTVVKSDDSSALLAGIISGVAVLLLMALLLCLYRRRSKKASFSKALKQAVREFSLNELKRATKCWSMLLGKGGYGSVYKAVLKDNTILAVKRLDQVSKQGDLEFVREVELLSRVHHRHLVNLVGFCAEHGERVLVYEYMAMGSLYEHLHGVSAKQFPLSWDSRTKIAIHIALGLEYLHYGADPPLIHRDIKSANILLSDDGYSKVADFGLCKEAPLGADGAGGEALQPTATAVRGSFGYLDPEYVNTSVLSEKSDVYSYGVVLLELITGHKSIHEWQPLAYWAEEYLSDREKTPLMVDHTLEGNFDVDELYALCEIARTCVQDQAVLRPTIRDVAKALVENLGHMGSSYGVSVGGDSQSLVSATDTSSLTGSSYTAKDTASGANTQSFTYQNYSETLHWDKDGSGKMSTSSGSTNMSTGARGDRLPVPVPSRPPTKPDELV